VRDYLAEERTFLAWIRTSLALIGFGFVVARFGLFLAEILQAPQALEVLTPLPPARRPPLDGDVTQAA
jgi:putative membrane protein